MSGEELFPLTCGELAPGENCIKIISGKSNSLGTFLGMQSDIFFDKHVHRFVHAPPKL